MKSREIALLERILTECGDVCSVDTTLDFKTIESRFEDQGLSFITITLPSFEAELISSLASEAVAPTAFPGFRKSGRIPIFLSGFLELIFNRTTGTILDEPSIDAIRSVRQICLAFGKMNIDCSPDRVRLAFDKFNQCELELEGLSESLDPLLRDRFVVIGNMLFGDVFRRMNDSVRDFSLSPKHGPGATADGLKANAKYALPMWTDRLEEVFPYWRYATSRGYRTTRYDSVEFREPGTEMPVRVISVPKTLKTPRIIAIEPTCMQFMQQALLASFSEYVKADFLLQHMIDSEHQEPNQLLARKGSIDGTLATLDLSEASDRVSNFLVQDLTRFFPHLYDGVQACRSRRASVPVISKEYVNSDSLPSMDRVEKTLHKFASMGSALTFPFEMAVFLTVIFIGIEKANGIRFRRKEDFLPYIGSVRVYGDDIIVPVATTSSVIDHLTLFGFVVNRRKSFWTGRFRESCGGDYFNGHDVTVTRVREEWPLSRRDVRQLVSAVSLRNQLYIAGYWTTVRWLDDEISNLIVFPAVADTSSVLGKTSFLPKEGERQCPKLHRPMVRGYKVQDIPRKSSCDGDSALMKFFLKKGDEPIFSKDHLEYAGRPISSKIRYGWGYID